MNEKLSNEGETPALNKGAVISSIMRVGAVCTMNGDELWVNTETDEIVKFVVKDRDLRWKYYCGKVRVTIELLDEA